MHRFPFENIPSIRSFINRGNKMFLKSLPYKGFSKKEVLITQKQVEAAKSALENLPVKD